MSLSIPQSVKQWSLSGEPGFDSLKLSECPLPALGDHQVLVKIQGASLNYRDLIIPMGMYPTPITLNVVPGSDGAGTVLSVGKNVKRFKPGDKVITVFNSMLNGGCLDPLSIQHGGLGGTVDGTFRTVGVFEEGGLVTMPSNLKFTEASTLTCAGLTAWNALFGLTDKKVLPGQWVLTQGTGGVSIFALQFAKAAGARVIATTSTSEKAELLKKLGADHIINYRETPEWGAKAKDLTGGIGVDHVVEVGGPATIKQSLASIKLDGVITGIGFVGGVTGDQPGYLESLSYLCTIRGICGGSRAQMEDMCRAVEAQPKALQPVLDPKVFSLDQLKEAYEYQWSGKHHGKVCVEID